MNRLRHRRLTLLLDAWIDGELDADQARIVAAHLTDCFDCSSAAEVTLLLKYALRARARREPTRLATARLHHFADTLTP